MVLPRSREEVAEVLRLALQKKIPYVIRGNGGSTAGFVFTEGIVIDLNRMKAMEIDLDNWTVSVEAGLTSFDVQKAVAKQGLRINAAEPAATVCGNIMCSGTFSTWANAYGIAGDNVVDAEFVAPDGHLFGLNEKTAPNLFAFTRDDVPSPGVCTRAVVKLHPVFEDESGVLVPFASFEDAVNVAKYLSMHRIGLAISVLGGHYLSAFMSPTEELAAKVRPALTDLLGTYYLLMIIGDRHAIEAVKKMKKPVIDNELLRMFMLGLPRLVGDEWRFLIRDLDSDQNAFELLVREEMRPLLGAVLSPSPENIASSIQDPELWEFYKNLYTRPEMTDLVWLNTFRIVSARMARHKHMFALIFYMPLDQQLIADIIGMFEKIAEQHGITHDYGFLTPLETGKRAVLEYDYYVDHTDEADRRRVQGAMPDIAQVIEGLYRDKKGVTWIKHIVSQGFSRKENILYI